MNIKNVARCLCNAKCMLAYAFISLSSSLFSQDKTVTEVVFDHDANMETFGFGADVSWLSQQESWGTYYCNRAGKRADLLDILKDDFGINAVRFRVWVNPSGGWSGKQDVINLSKRAHAKGMKIMISFHYSDTWADSGNQTIPAQWTDHSAEALARNVYDHTRDVLSGLKKEGIIPRWVSLGNETKYGMLYETGRTKTTEGMKNFVKFINAGAKAVKEISPDIITIIHLSNGHDEATARNMFDNLEKYGANYDCIGLSCYPRWSHIDIDTDAKVKSAVNTYITVLKNLNKRFGKPIMVMETGHYCDQPYDANRFLADFMKALISNNMLGCFYWEPESFDNSGYNLGAWSSKTHQGTIAMDAFRGIKHTKVDKYATTIMSQPQDTLIYSPTDTVEMKVYAKSPTTVTSVTSVDFYLNDKLLQTISRNGQSSYFILQTDTLPRGAYAFHALANDDQGHRESTDTVSFMVGHPTVFQENSDGFVGTSGTTVTIEKKQRRYTGEGYIPSSSARKDMIYWSADFPAAGTYTMYVRYHSTDKRSMQFHLGESSFIVTGQVTPQNRWAYSSKEFTVETPGVQQISLQGLTKGYPDIDFIAIESPEGIENVRYGDVTSIESAHLPTTATMISDLQGRRYPSSSVLPRGIYILSDGSKKLVR